jgi:hypothetical protein
MHINISPPKVIGMLQDEPYDGFDDTPFQNSVVIAAI